MWIKLAIIGAIAMSLMGALGSFIYAQREIGAAAEREKLAEDKAAVEADIARANQEGKLEFARLYEQAMRRQKQAETQAATDALVREAANEAQARHDAVYADWRERPVPAYVVQRLRNLTVITADEQSRNSVPSGASVPPVTLVPANSGEPEESLAGRLRRIFSHSVAPRVEAK